ncbi:hypothetical protein [Facklamia miroungae]|uniref:Uncharacterized protein n=1 Tax=Facklamia miroungae TaxID=120956 RepID=A0A1G7QYM5_9LACT|nr:hypothetical protein [Facklamia miroungae]NKZ29113.1 hypothetical protein [Facklamia miroungae]SDG03613.1 hypothetical protein SAMN05421791_102269 [Facklamia miroungae]
MTDLIHLPNNDENFYRKAINALENNDLDQANTLLEESYRIEPSIKVFKELIHLNLIRNKPDPIKKLWKDFLSINALEHFDFELASLYVHSLPRLFAQHEQLIKLYELKDLFDQKEWNTTFIIDQIQQIKQQDQILNEIQFYFEKNQIDQLIDKLRKQTIFELLKTIKIIYSLDFSIKHSILSKLLLQKEISQFVKSDILHHYLYQDYRIKLKIAWFGTIETINIQELYPYKEDPTYLTIKSLLENYTNDNNPHIFEGLLTEINLLMMVYYPFIDQKITEPVQWFNTFLAYYNIEEGATPDQDTNTLDILQQAIKEIKQLGV